VCPASILLAGRKRREGGTPQKAAVAATPFQQRAVSALYAQENVAISIINARSCSPWALQWNCGATYQECLVVNESLAVASLSGGCNQTLVELLQ
jgi:hypothetical protein